MTDPAKRLEQQFAYAQDAEARAIEYDTRGWTQMAKLARRQLAGHRAAISRITRELS